MANLFHVFIADPEPAVAQAIGALAIESLPAEAETVVAKCTTLAGARRLLDRMPSDESTLAIVVCASELSDGNGVDLLTYARRLHPHARVVLMTNGERDGIIAAQTGSVDGLVSRPDALVSLRAIIEFLGRDACTRIVEREGSEAREFQRAAAALEVALEAVVRAHERLAPAAATNGPAALQVLSAAERHAVMAHRAVLDAERKLLGIQGPPQMA